MVKVAIVHDYLREYGGAERVLETIHQMFPDAPVFTAYLNLKSLGENAKRFKDWEIRPSWFQKFPFADRLLSPFRVFGPMMFESFDMDPFDLVISSSSATHLAKAVITKPECLHISYIHTPPRFLYGYVTSFNYKKHWWTKVGGEIINHIMRIYDFEVSQRPDILVANSKNVQKRIQKFYRRNSVVIYPPVDLSEIRLQLKKEDYFLVLNRLVRGKGTENIVEAVTRLGVKLKVAGTGPELDDLKKRAGKNVQFLGWVSDDQRVELLSLAKALIVGSEDEDFGITSIEAQAAGTPVIAINKGGYLETVIEGKTGAFFSAENPVESLVEVLEKFQPTKFKPDDCRKNAEKFSTERFKRKIQSLIDKNKSSFFTNKPNLNLSN